MSQIWFKHMCSASDGTFLNTVMEEYGHQGYAVYFLFIELCMQRTFEKPDEKLRFHKRKLKEKLRISYTKVEQMLKFFSTMDQFSYNKIKDIYEFEFPKLLLIMNRDSNLARKKRAVPAQPAPIEREIERELDKEIEIENKSKKAKVEKTKKPKGPAKPTYQNTVLKDFENPSVGMTEFIDKRLSTVPTSVQEHWIEMYPDDTFRRRAFLKIVNWCEANPQKIKNRTGWTAFIGTWLESDWQKHLKSIPGKRAENVFPIRLEDISDFPDYVPTKEASW